MEVMTSLSDFYIQTKTLDKGKKIAIEMENGSRVLHSV